MPIILKMFRQIFLIFFIFPLVTNASIGESCGDYNWLKNNSQNQDLLLLQSQVTALKLASLIEIHQGAENNDEREKSIAFLSKIGSPLTDTHPILKTFKDHKYHDQLRELINESQLSLKSGKLSISYQNMPILLMAYEMSTESNIFNNKDFAIATFWQDLNPNENLVNPILEQLIEVYYELNRKEREKLYHKLAPLLEERWQQVIEAVEESGCENQSTQQLAYSINCGSESEKIFESMAIPFEEVSLEVMDILNFDLRNQFTAFSRENLEWRLHPPPREANLTNGHSDVIRTFSGVDFKEYRNQKSWYREISNRDNLSFLQTFKSLEARGPYLVLDKSKDRIFLYESDGTLKGSIDAGLGTRTDQRADTNMPEPRGAGAGIYELMSVDASLLTLTDQRSRAQLLETLENGVDCFSGSCTQIVGNLEALLKRHLITLPLPFYILPQDEGLEFTVKNDQLSFTTYQKLDDYFSYNFTPRQTEAKETRFTIENSENDTPFAREFLAALSQEKQKIMDLYGLDNDEYNELAILAFGILGQESQFGSHWRYHIKESFPGGVAYLKNYKRIFSNFGKDRQRDGFWSAVGGLVKDSWNNEIGFLTGGLSTHENSRGPTQIKNVPDLIEQTYNVTKDNISEPKNAAVATLGFLAQSLEELKSKEKFHPAINGKNRFEYLHYIYMGLSGEIINATATPEKNIYYNNVLRYSDSLKIWESLTNSQ